MRAVRERAKKVLSITTKREEPKDLRKHIVEMSEADVSKKYRLGGQVMESTNTGMEVLHAIRLSDGMRVVIKTRSKQESFKSAREEREWRMTTEQQLNMPKVETLCQLYEVIETRYKYYIVMEKVNGRDLFEQMASEKLTHLEARETVRQILDALRVLHASGRIHKDLKIENVMVDMQSPTKLKMMKSQSLRSPGSASSRTGLTFGRSASETPCPQTPVEAKLIDFDTVQDWEPTSPKSRDVLGTDGYIAPEAYSGDYSPASDVYAAGVIMYKLLTTKFPSRSDMFDDQPGENWVGSPAMKRIKERLKSARIDFTLHPLDKCQEAADLCAQMLSYDAEARPSAAEALRHDWFLVDPEGLP